MSYLEKQNKVREKILEHSDFIFSKEEKYIIKNDDNLTKLYWKTLIKYPELMDTFTSADDFAVDLEFDSFDGASLEFALKLAKVLFDSKEDKEDILGLSPLLDESIRDDYILGVESIYRDKPKDELVDGQRIDSYLLKELIESGNFEYIVRNQDYIDFDYFDLSTNIDFSNKFPFDKYQITSFEKYYIKEWNRKRLDEVILSKLTSDSKFSLSFLLKLFGNQSKKSDLLTELITRRLLDGDSNIELLRDETYFSVESMMSKFFYDELSDEKRVEIFKRLIDNGNIDVVFILAGNFYGKGDSFSSSIDEFTFNEDELGKIIEKLKSGKKIYFNTPVVKRLMANPEFRDAIIRSGSIDVLMSYDNLTEDDIDKMINEINREGSNYTLPIDKPWQTLIDNPKLFKALLDNNLFTNDGLTYTFSNKEIRDIIVDKILNGFDLKMDFDTLFEMDPDIVEILIINGYDKMIPDYGGNELWRSQKFKNPELVVEKLKEDYLLASNLFKSCPKRVLGDSFLLSFYMSEKSPISEEVIEYIMHHDDDPSIYTEEVYQALKDYYVKECNLDEKHIETLKEKFGLRVFRFLDDEQVQKLINLEDDKFDKIIDLFSMKKLEISDMEMFYDVVMQYDFPKKHPEVISIFADIKHSLDDGSEDYLEKISNLKTIMDEKFFQKFKEEYQDINFSDADDLLTTIIAKMQKGNIDEQIKYTDMLHFITNYYIESQREKYVKENYHMLQDLNLPYDIDNKDFIVKLIKKLSNPCDTSIVHSFDLNRDILAEYLVSKGMDRELVLDCMACYCQDKEHKNTYDRKTIGKSMKDFVKYSMEFIESRPTDVIDDERYAMDQGGEIKREYFVPPGNMDIFQILTELRVDVLEKIVDDEKLYSSLLKTMQKYRLHLMPDSVREFVENTMGMSIDQSGIAAFISYYESISTSEERRLASSGKEMKEVMPAISVLTNVGVYGSASSVYSLILGNEDFKLIKSNPGPNSATRKIKNNERLKEAVRRTKENYERQEVTVPSFNEVVSINNSEGSESKQMRVVVGNFTHPSNLSHGERTGACMRIGGVGESLFEFCLEDPNGFHIRFEDPETGAYISRVSGFRNGNTIFLNELRCSCDRELFSDKEVVAACREASRMLIEMSRDSDCPIDNVVLHSAYATESEGLEVIPLNITDNKTGLRAFYSDVGTSAILLASSASDGSLVPIDFDKSEVPTYPVAREQVKAIKPGDDAKSFIETINRVDAVKAILDGKDYEYLEPKAFEEEILFGFASQDWYIYVDQKGEMHSNLITIDKRAKEEQDRFRAVLAEIQEKKGDHDNGIENQARQSK